MDSITSETSKAESSRSDGRPIKELNRIVSKIRLVSFSCPFEAKTQNLIESARACSNDLACLPLTAFSERKAGPQAGGLKPRLRLRPAWTVSAMLKNAF